MLHKYENRKGSLSAFLFIAAIVLFMVYNNCSGINLLPKASPEEVVAPSSTPMPSPEPVVPPVPPNPPSPPPIGDPIDPRADTIDYSLANPPVTTEVSCQTDGMGGTYSQGDLTTVKGTGVPSKTVIGGIEYKLIIAVGGTNLSTEGCGQSTGEWDPVPYSPLHISQRHNTFKGGVIAFRVRTTDEPAHLHFNYYSQNGTGELGRDGFFSVSKIPGQIDAAKPDSESYCNLGRQDGMDSSDVAIATSNNKCRLLQDSVYYFNVLNTNKKESEYVNSDWFVFSLQAVKY